MLTVGAAADCSGRFSTGSSAVKGRNDIPSSAIVQNERIVACDLAPLYQDMPILEHTKYQIMDSIYGFQKPSADRLRCAIFECAATDSWCNPRTVLFLSIP